MRKWKNHQTQQLLIILVILNAQMFNSLGISIVLAKSFMARATQKWVLGKKKDCILREKSHGMNVMPKNMSKKNHKY